MKARKVDTMVFYTTEVAADSYSNAINSPLKSLFFEYFQQNTDCNLKFHLTKLYFLSENEVLKTTINNRKLKIKVSVNLGDKHKVEVKKFTVRIFYFPAFFLRSLAYLSTSTISFSISIFLFFEDFFNAAKVQINIKER